MKAGVAKGLKTWSCDEVLSRNMCEQTTDQQIYGGEGRANCAVDFKGE